MHETPRYDRTSRFQRAEDLFHAALRRPVAEREIWVHQQSDYDTGIRAEVVSLLAASQQASELGLGSVSAGDPQTVQTEFKPRRMGAYRLESSIGRGGMGAVYLARRVDGEFDQTVAIKVMAAHLAGSAFLNNFLRERQVLARLNHPNITRLLDGGVSDGGEPYLVMEYVDGQPLDRYCDDRKLPIDARLAVFLQVCQAVEYAHRNLIVHRDLKPGNILVTDEGIVKLLDFGTAKLMGDQTAAATQAGLMTPRYASPEQLRGEPVTTASDVFSLGVILFELLTGAWPFGNPQSSLDELDRMLRGHAPSQPVQVITEQAAGRRALSCERLRRELSGDLSTILSKMLESEPTRRYGSVRQVAEDLERYRQGRPILARPPTSWYRVRKFVRRNWLAVSAASIAVLALAGLTAFSLEQSIQVRKQAVRAERISEFAKTTFLSASTFWKSPLRGKSAPIQFSDILDNAAERVGKELGNDPLAEADMRGTLGMTYSMLGNPEKGEAQLTLALQRLRQSGDKPPQIETSILSELCDTFSFQGRYAQALTSCQEALAAARRARGNVPLGLILHDTAFMTAKSGAPLEDAEALYREALRVGPAGGADVRLYPSLINTRIGGLRVLLGDLDEGEALLRSAERFLRNEPGPPIEIIPAIYGLSLAARIRGQYQEAIRLLNGALDILNQRPTAFMSRDEIELELAADEALAGRDGALVRSRSVIARLQPSGYSPLERARHEMFVGIVESRNGLSDSANEHLRRALATCEKEAPRQPAIRVEMYVRLAELLEGSERASEASEVARQGLSVAEASYGRFYERHPFVLELKRYLR